MKDYCFGSLHFEIKKKQIHPPLRGFGWQPLQHKSIVFQAWFKTKYCQKRSDQLPPFTPPLFGPLNPPTVESVELKIDKPMRIMAFLARTSLFEKVHQAEGMVFEFNRYSHGA